MQELPRPVPPPTWRDRIAEFQFQGLAPPRLLMGAAAVVVAAALIGVVVVVTGGTAGAKTPKASLSLPRADQASATGGASSSSPSTTTGDLHVDAAGAVARSGVVVVPAGSRVTDVVTAAGGPAPDADLDQVNLAALVTDGERIYVPHKGEVVAGLGVGGATPGPLADSVVNLNDADETALETLPGVGPTTAKAILDYRSQHGRFKSVDELLNVHGIGPSKLSEIKPHARV